MSRRDWPLIVQALTDAADWQDSISDAHHRAILPCHRSRQNSAWARRADKTRDRYLALQQRILATIRADRE